VQHHRARVVRDSPWGMLRQHIMEVDDASLPRAVMLHDSFGAYVDRLLAEHFSRLACYWQYDFDTRLIAAEQPDVVIELYVERTLCNVYAPDFKAHPIDRGEEAFRASERVLYALDAARDAPLVRPQGRAQVRLTHDDAGSALVIDTRSEGDTVVLPDFEFASGERAVLHFDIASPDATDMYVLYKRAGEDEYSRRNNCVVQLRKGENRGYAVVDDTNLRGALCIRPGGSAGPYTLRAFEVRALPAQ